MQTNVYLIGLMGAGKTTVGRKLARLLRADFIDTDQMLEARTGVPVSHIFELEGERGFRAREAKLLAELSRPPRPGGGAVIATGGGVILCESNRRALRRSGTVVYLRATAELLWERVKDSRTRPLLSAPDPKSKIAQLLDERAPLYAAQADITVDVGLDASAESASKMASHISALLQRDAIC